MTPAYATALLERMVDEVASAPKGHRHHTLFRNGARLADIAAAGLLDPATTEARLEDAAKACGMRGRDITHTIADVFRRADPDKVTVDDEDPGPELLLGGRVIGGVPRPTPRQATPVATPPSIKATVPQLLPPAARLPPHDLSEVDCVTAPIPEKDVVGMVYGSLTSTSGAVHTWTWRDLVLAVARPQEGNSGKLWAFHDIENNSRARVVEDDGGTRAPVVERLHALMLDYDDDDFFSPETIDLWWGGVRFVAHTTRSNGKTKKTKPARPRGRVVVALSRPITPSELTELRPWLLSGRFGVVGSVELKAPARCYFMPVPADGYWCHYGDGEALDVDAMLEAVKPPEPQQELGPTEPDINTAVSLAHTVKADGAVGGVIKSLSNVCTVLELDPRWSAEPPDRPKLWFDEFSGLTMIDDAQIRDVDEARLARWLDDTYDLRVSSAMASEAASVVADDRKYHPVRSYLRSMFWDGTPRLDSWLTRICLCPDDVLSAAYGRCWMISAVARIMRPGCKVDSALVLVGSQGTRKSTALRILAGSEWFSDSPVDVRNKDAMMAVRGVWIYEWAELDALRRAEATAVKAFLSSPVDRYRPSYGRHMVTQPRQCVFVGTANDDGAGLLTDSTGSRRFWIREVSDIHLDALEAERDQLWAEAVARFDDGENWWLPRELEEARASDASTYQREDSWEEVITSWLLGRNRCTINQVLSEAVKKATDNQTKLDSIRAAAILQERGWRKRRTTVLGRRVTVWEPKVKK